MSLTLWQTPKIMWQLSQYNTVCPPHSTTGTKGLTNKNANGVVNDRVHTFLKCSLLSKYMASQYKHKYNFIYAYKKSVMFSLADFHNKTCICSAALWTDLWCRLSPSRMINMDSTGRNSLMPWCKEWFWQTPIPIKLKVLSQVFVNVSVLNFIQTGHKLLSAQATLYLCPYIKYGFHGTKVH